MPRQIIYVLFLFVGLQACKSKKFVYTTPMPERTKAEIYQALQDHNYDFTWFAGKGGIKLDTPEERVSGSAYLRIRKDSVIWSVVRKLSIEAVRSIITPTEFAMINRIDNTYAKGTTDNYLQKLGIAFNYEDMQQSFFGNVMLPDSNSMTMQKDSVFYHVQSQEPGVLVKYWVNGYDLSLHKVSMIDDYSREISIIYDDYQTIENKARIAFSRQYLLPTPEGEVAEIKLNFKEIELDVPKSTKFRIPNHYERVD